VYYVLRGGVFATLHEGQVEYSCAIGVMGAGGDCGEGACALKRIFLPGKYAEKKILVAAEAHGNTLKKRKDINGHGIHGRTRKIQSMASLWRYITLSCYYTINEQVTT
jgi:hypothetical protein